MTRWLPILAIALASAAYGQTLPAGTYREVCEDITMDGNNLIATCPHQELDHSPGTPVRSVFQPGWCKGDIFNANGWLACEFDPANGERRKQAKYFRGQVAPIPPPPDLPQQP